MDLPHMQEFLAEGKMCCGTSFVPCTIIGKYAPYGLGEVQCKVIIRKSYGQELKNLLDFSTPPREPVQLYGTTTEHAKDIWMTNLSVRQVSQAYPLQKSEYDESIIIEGIAHFYVEGDLRAFEVESGSLTCSVTLTPTPLTPPDLDIILEPNGTISRSNKDYRDIEWNTALGKAKLIDTYHYINETIGLDNARIQVKKTQILFDSIELHGEISFKTIFSQLESLLEEPMLLLSFLSKSSLFWYEANTYFFSSTDCPDLYARALRRQASLSKILPAKEIALHNIPVRLESLQSGVFEQLLDTYETSPLKNTIKQTIQYLLRSYESIYFEANLGIIYTAFESLVDGLSKHHQMTAIMNGSQFKKLSKQLRNAILESVPDQAIAESVIEKIGELKRPAMKERLLKLLEIYHLDKIRYTPHGTSIQEVIPNLLQRRNKYIHAGEVDKEHAVTDLLFLQELIEFWILKLLDCPLTALNLTYYRYSHLTLAFDAGIV